jgi:hypothetical protein
MPGQWKIELCLCQWWIQHEREVAVVAVVAEAVGTTAMKM